MKYICLAASSYRFNELFWPSPLPPQKSRITLLPSLPPSLPPFLPPFLPLVRRSQELLLLLLLRL